MSESFPAHARKVSSCDFGCDIHAEKKLNSPSASERAFASLYAGSNLLGASVSRLPIGIQSPLVMLNENNHFVLFGFLDQVLMMRQKLGCRLGDKNMKSVFYRIHRDGVMCACPDRQMN